MKIATYACEICQRRRDSDANHWFVGTIFGVGPDAHRIWQIEEWSETAAEVEGAVHLCGQAHAMEWIGKELSK